ncbi:unnamed protein product [Brassica napus]|uniref:(rape) hypothetical protein n=1 Tax=Brassica napus TaxID=3708 RepID=A0A816TWH9_BRANA|nr:unnamed protein product [Brassica napus]
MLACVTTTFAFLIYTNICRDFLIYFYRLLQNFLQLIPNSTSIYTLLINKIYINQTPTSSPLETPWKFAGRVYTYKHTCNKRRIIAGGFQGDLICKHLDRPGVSFCSRTSYDDNAITNAIEIYNKPSGALHFTASNNDCGVRDFDMERYQLVKHFSFPWPVNHASLSPNGKLLAIVGDNPEGLIVDPNTGKTLETLSGHFDYSFASAWHPDGITFSTGNQYKTCRVWDIRNLSHSVAVLKGNLGAIRSIRYMSDGKYMAMAEPADFVHVYEFSKGYETEQEIDFFGEISGISISPDTQALFIGVWDRTYGSLLEYHRRRNYTYLDSFL